MLNVFISLDFYRNATDHEDDFIGMLGNVLVHPALQVGEPTLHGIVTHTTRSDFVGDEDEGGILGGEAVKLSLQGFEGFVHVC